MPCAGRIFRGERRRSVISRAVAGIFLLFLAAPALPAPGAEGATPKKTPREPAPAYRSAILIEAESGQILKSHNHLQPVIPASVVKMMTTLLALESVRQKKTSLSDRVTASRAASRVGGHQVHLRQGEVFRFEDLLKAVLVGSANDAAHAVAEHVAGSEAAFVRMMNQRARQLGLNETRFVNPHGLPAGNGTPSNLMSARDAAMLARKLIRDFPFVLEWTSTRVIPFRPGKFNVHNTNKLLGHFEGLDGLKTGFTPESGFSVVATAKRGKLRLIGVVFGSPQSQRRFNEAKGLLAWGFSNYHWSEASQKPLRNDQKTHKTRTPRQNPGDAPLPQERLLRLSMEGEDFQGIRAEAALPREEGETLLAAKPAVQHLQSGVMQLR
ncbi:MAG: D-alanyl-D-alanine carboxypeptidase family protein [Nitrospinota bacterium]